MALSDFLMGRKGGFEQVPAMTGQQTQLLNQLLGGLGAPLQSGLGNLAALLGGDVEAYEAPAMRQFREEIVPGIAERFSGAGAGAQASSAFGQQLGAQAAGLSERLAMQRAALQQQGLGQLGGLLGYGLGARPFESIYRPETTGFLGAMAPGIGSALGMGLTGGMSKLGKGLSSLLNLFRKRTVTE